MLCAKAKTRHRVRKFVELVGLNRMNRFFNDISTKFVGKTTEHTRVRPVRGTHGRYMPIRSQLGITRFYTKLAEAVLRSITPGHAGVTSALKKPLKGSKTGLNSRKRSARYVLMIVYSKNAVKQIAH